MNSAIRIFTGAVVPDGFDTVAMQEDVRVEMHGEMRRVFIPAGLKQGANRRLAGEDCAEGSTLVEPGTRLRPQDVASAAACGLSALQCFAPLKVGIVSTGDEILRPGAPFAAGKVYDANAPMLAGLVQAAGAVPIDLGVLPDELEDVRAALENASKCFNVLVVSGGASLGAEDHVVKADRCPRQASSVADRHQTWASNVLWADRRLRHPRASRQSRRCIRLFSYVCAAGARYARGGRLAGAGPLSPPCSVYTEEKGWQARVLARASRVARRAIIG